MRLTIVAVGKIKQAGLRADLDDYYKRIRRYAGCEEVELKDAPERDVAARMARAIPERALVAALEVDGVQHDSASFARWIGQCEQTAVHGVAFLIGGAYGLPAESSARAQVRLSLSRLTMPHRLARVVLAEQLYRAFTILRGEPYAH
jgi:23S rRNA (pseudouridine1915-N3)-methyltransferase